MKIAFLGTGNMLQAIIRGILKNGVNPNDLIVTRRRLDHLQAFADEHKIQISNNNITAIQNASIVFIGVKPQNIEELCQEIKEVLLKTKPIIISVAAGITTARLQNLLSYPHKIIRTMPNTPATIGKGVTGVFATDNLSATELSLTLGYLQSIGSNIIVNKETEINIINAISGSGPAYYYYFTEALIASGIELGLSPELAKELAVKTAEGAALLMSDSELSVEELRRQVTSPNGTTDRAIKSFIADNLFQTVSSAVHKCKERAEELSKA